MKKIRIYEIAKDLNIAAKELKDILNQIGFNIENHMAAVTEEEAQNMMKKLAEFNRSAKAKLKDIKSDIKKENADETQKQQNSKENSQRSIKKSNEGAEKLPKESKLENQKENEFITNKSSMNDSKQAETREENIYKKNKDSKRDNISMKENNKSNFKRNEDKRQEKYKKDFKKADDKSDRKENREYNKDRKDNKEYNKDKRVFDKNKKSYQENKSSNFAEKRQFGQKKDFVSNKDKVSDEKRHVKRDFKKDTKIDPTKEELSAQIKKEEKRKELKIEEKKRQKDKKKVYNRFESGEEKFQKRDLTKKTQNKKKKDKTKHQQEEVVQVFDGSHEDGMFVIGETITVGKLSELLKIQSTEVIMKLIKMGIMASINQEIKFETAESIAMEYDILLIKQEEEEEDVFAIEIEEDRPEDLLTRAPIVTVMGHVDHGKTTLLDTIRNTGVALKEAGGITQHIGASEVLVDNRKIVFLDTPGHEAFTEMRARGAKVTDIAIIVVAADDGIMPQTVEAINHVKAAGVPMIIAINKIDKPTASIDKVRQELSGYDVLVEEWGGNIIDVPVSAKTGEGMKNLLDMILILADMEELKANPNRRAIGSVIESNLDKGRGAVATVLVQTGTLKVGDAIVAGASYGKVRAMINSKGNRTGKVGPSTAVEILGLSEVPNAGDSFIVVASDKEAREIAEKRKEKLREDYIKATSKIHLEDLFSQMKEGEVKELKLIVKADVQGSIEALKTSLEKISNEEVIVKVIHGGVGAITESDVMLASASNAIIIGFNVRPVSGALALSQKEKVDIRSYSIIYKAIEEIETAMKGMLAPQYVEEQLGTAEVRMVFKVPGAGMAAGSYVTNGKITRNAQVRLVRDGIVIYNGKIDSLRRFKDEVKEVASGYECGISFEKYSDIKEMDIIEAYEMKEVKR